MTAPHVQVIQIHSSSAPPSEFPAVSVLIEEGDQAGEEVAQLVGVGLVW